jgi:glycosyltransferase involved in cell wall biosynthesis
MDKPLVSFSIVSYNQEAFIREAVAGALAQTYSPLEIIISDDCSKDRTFDIVQEMAAAYKGPHTIRLNRNPTNLGIAENSNRASAMCRGELLVGSAGDDISMPERTSIIVRAWNDSGRRSTSLASRFVVIDACGRLVEGEAEPCVREESVRWVHEQGTIPGFLRRRKPHVAGCVHAISRKLITDLGPLPRAVIYEDTALCFRTVLVGGYFTFIDAPLVKYRRHSQNLTFALHEARPQDASAFEEFRMKRRIELDRFVEVYKSFAADAERAMQQGIISPADYPGLKKWIQMEGKRFALKRELLDQPWFRRLCIFFQLYSNTIRPREMLEHVQYLLPGKLYRHALITWNRMRRQVRKPKL